MPFKDDLQEVYDKAIKPACVKTGFESLRVDELQGPFNINRKIIEYLFSSDAIIADLTGWNPNVFYEMGVAHTLDNKTLMIIQKKDQLPFDVSNYRCLIYEQTKPGLEKLLAGIAEALSRIDEWRRHPTNPVQEFKLHDAFIPRSVVDKLQRELMEKNELLAASVPKTAYEIIQKRYEFLSNQTLNKKSAKASPKTFTQLNLRSQALESLSHEEVKRMLKEKSLFDNDWNNTGGELRHKYELLENGKNKIMMDHITGLVWQQSGSEGPLDYTKAQNYVVELRQMNWGGYKNWRLPTLEEAMSLMEREKNGALHIDPLFDQKQSWVWTADKENAAVAWVVNYNYGICLSRPINDSRYVRAVR